MERIGDDTGGTSATWRSGERIPDLQIIEDDSYEKGQKRTLSVD